MVLRVRAQMPGDELPPRPAGWLAGVIGIVALTVGLGIALPLDAGDRSPYRDAVTGYPAREVLVCLAIMIGEALACVAVLRARGTAPTAARALACAAVALLLLFLLGPLAIHADRPISSLIAWNCVAIAWLGLYGVIRIVAAALWAIARWLTP